MRNVCEDDIEFHGTQQTRLNRNGIPKFSYNGSVFRTQHFVKKKPKQTPGPTCPYPSGRLLNKIQIRSTQTALGMIQSLPSRSDKIDNRNPPQ